MRRKPEKELFEEIYQTFLCVYHHQLTRQQAANQLFTTYDKYKKNTYLRYLDSFLHMMDGTQFASVVPIDLSAFFIQRIQQDFGTKALEKALLAEKQHIQYYYNATGTRQSGLCDTLQKISLQFSIPMSFSPQ